MRLSIQIHQITLLFTLFITIYTRDPKVPIHLHNHKVSIRQHYTHYKLHDPKVSIRQQFIIIYTILKCPYASVSVDPLMRYLLSSNGDKADLCTSSVRSSCVLLRIVWKVADVVFSSKRHARY
jgi:hypothetical protein